ncbi:hypothetical protein, partial [Nonomuraea sp. NPDC003201]
MPGGLRQRRPAVGQGQRAVGAVRDLLAPRGEQAAVPAVRPAGWEEAFSSLRMRMKRVLAAAVAATALVTAA